MTPITFHCARCARVLGRNRYTISPFTGRPLRKHALCPECFEQLFHCRSDWPDLDWSDADDEDEDGCALEDMEALFFWHGEE
jgi:hypothetical protein